MNINEHILQIHGKATLLEPIERDHAYKIFIEGEITDVREPSNDDGTVDRIYIFKVARAEVTDQLGKVTKTRDARKQSQKMRAIIKREWENLDNNMDEETYYQRRTSEIMSKMIEGEI